MDSFHSAKVLSSSNNISKLADSKITVFLSTYRRHQAWSLPDSLVFHMAKNPLSAKCYEIMLQTCKYFFIKNPILVVCHLYLRYNSIGCFTEFNGKRNDINKIINKIWVTDKLDIFNYNSVLLNCISSFIPKIYQCDIKNLEISKQNISINELKFLGSKCEYIYLEKSIVINENGSVVTLEKIVGILPSIKNFYLCFGENAFDIVTSKAVQELLQIPHFLNLECFALDNVPESFDIDIFYEYIKENKEIKIRLIFCVVRSPIYFARLQAIVNEINAKEIHEYKILYIQFPWMQESSFFHMQKLNKFNYPF